MGQFGKYQLIAQLGEGGMAQVYLAAVAGPRGSGFSKLTVVKRLRSTFEDEPEFITMLVDEARIAARLNHPNVVQTHEVGEVDGKYFIAMEYLDGHSLHRVLNRSTALLTKSNGADDGGFTKDMGYVVLLDVLAGLHHAHELTDYDGTSFGIVHRDVTPQNIFITYEGQVKVVDFGVAKAAGRGSETRHGVIKGKVRYMSPEQATSREIDRRADIFAVGLLMWEVLTGERRWQMESEMAIVQSLLADEVYIPPENRKIQGAPEIEAMMKKALSKDPADRFATADEFRRELEKYLASTGKLVEARSNLGPTIATMFKDKRDALKLCIEKQLSVSHSSEVAPMMLTVHADLERSASQRKLEGSSSMPVESASVITPPKSRSRIGMVLAGAGVIGIAVVLGLALRSTRNTGAANAVATHDNPPPAVLPPASDLVAVTVNVTPPTARILLDGVQVFSPYDVKVERSGAPHSMRVEADGYEPQTKTFAFDRNVALSISLSKLSPEATAAAAIAKTPTWVPAAPRTPAAAPKAPDSPRASVAPTPIPPTPNPALGAGSVAPPPVDAATAAANKKRDIDRGNPFAQGTGQPKAVDKGNPFNK